jgi:hypothetical protein
MKSILFKDKLPYLLTILIGLAAYQINNVIQLYTDAPTLAYKFETISEQVSDTVTEKMLECTLTNFGKQEALRDITIHISYKTDLPDPKNVMEPIIFSVAPATIIPDTMVSAAYGYINEYKIPVIHPNTSYVLGLKSVTNSEIMEFPKLYFSSSQSIKLTEHNLEIFLINNQVMINIILLGIWIVFIIIYFFMLSSKKNLRDEKNS